MNEASVWRKQLAVRLIERYARASEVEAIIIGGSVSRGCADSYSDLEIGVFWKRLPNEDIRKAVITEWNGFIAVFNSYRSIQGDALAEGAEECFYLGGNATQGLKVDIYHKNVASAEQILDDVIDRYDATIEKQELVSTIYNAISLFGHQHIATWKDKVAKYPQGLADAMVREHLRFNPHFGSAMLIDRAGMFLELRRILISYEERILCTLMGLNHIYHRGDYKWLDNIIQQMHLAPSELLVRMQMVHQSNPQIAWKVISDLIHETCSLIEEHMPHINTHRARAWFTVQRRIWDHCPV